MQPEEGRRPYRRSVTVRNPRVRFGGVSGVRTKERGSVGLKSDFFLPLLRTEIRDRKSYPLVERSGEGRIWGDLT